MNSAPRGDSLNRTFAALSDPTRRAILVRLMRGEASVTELVAPFDLTQPTISKHLKVLGEAGLIERRRDAQFRRCRLKPKRLAEAWVWLGNYQVFWEESFDRLNAYAKRLHDRDNPETADGPRKKRR